MKLCLDDVVSGNLRDIHMIFILMHQMSKISLKLGFECYNTNLVGENRVMANKSGDSRLRFLVRFSIERLFFLNGGHRNTKNGVRGWVGGGEVKNRGLLLRNKERDGVFFLVNQHFWKWPFFIDVALPC